MFCLIRWTTGRKKASFFCTVLCPLLTPVDWWVISVILKMTLKKKLCVAEGGQRQHKITGYCKASEKAIAQLLTLQMLLAEAVLLFWQHCWDLYVLTGDQGNISWLTTLGIVESLYETNKMRWLTCISEGGEPASAVRRAGCRSTLLWKLSPSLQCQSPNF